MASYGWRNPGPVEDGLFEEGHRFAFVQAVRLLEDLYLRGNRTAPAEGADPEREVVHFRHAVRMDFPAGDVEDVEKPTVPGAPAEMTVNVLGLAGVHGPLPPAVSELIVERSFRKDTAFRDFLDIFNHRLISLLYRARKKYRPALDPGSPNRGRMARVLNAFLGLATPHLLRRMNVQDRALLPYAGLLLDRHRSTLGLVRLLEDYFEVGVAVVPFRGRWQTIEEDDTTRIGVSGQNQLLGQGAMLGGRVWDEESGIEVQLGALPFEQFLAFLPTGHSHRALIALVGFYLRAEIGFTVRLKIAAAAVPKLQIGKGKPVFLGWTSWLTTAPLAAADAQVRLRGRA